MSSPARASRTRPIVLAAILVGAAVALTLVAVRGSAPPQSLQDRVRSVASTLRCPVCQNLSVADSPSKLATQMRTTIAQELQAGRSPEDIRSEFATAYGEWVLLAPPKRGLDAAIWLAPLLVLVVGAAAAVVAVRRWTAGAMRAAPGQVASGAVAEPALSDADRRLLERALAGTPEEPE
jgi:cytochrome c-type biogenesis protein CcmH